MHGQQYIEKSNYSVCFRSLYPLAPAKHQVYFRYEDFIKPRGFFRFKNFRNFRFI